jgi:hypothetical protein
MRQLLGRILPFIAFMAGVVIGSMGAECKAQTIGINTVTAHATGGHRWWTPGAYLRTDSGIAAGILRNSEGSWGAHVSQTWRVQPLGIQLDLQAGAITGYRRAPVLPLATASVLVGQTRLVWIPGPRGGAMHLAGEW